MLRLSDGSYKVDRLRYGGPPYCEVWAFRPVQNRTIRPPINRQKAKRIAGDFLKSNPRIFGLNGGIKTLRAGDAIRSIGGWHVIHHQRLWERFVHGGYVTVHLDNQGRVYMAKSRAVPAALTPQRPPRFRKPESAARASAFEKLRADNHEEIQATIRNVEEVDVEKVWFPKGNRLLPAFRFRFYRKNPSKGSFIYVHGLTGKVLWQYDTLKQGGGRGRVFDPNPVAALGDHKLLVAGNKVKTPPPRAYRTVRLRGLRSTGYLTGCHVTTKHTEPRVKRHERNFYLKSGERGFEEVMAYYHIDAAVRYLKGLGFRGDRAIFKRPLCVDARRTDEGDSWYSRGLGRLNFGFRGDVADAEDGEKILHEFGHALQDAICPNFGQSSRARAMGEGFADYLAASFFADKKPAKYRTSVMTWNKIVDEYDPPRRVDRDSTFDKDYIDSRDEHDNGPIWSTTLWDIRKALGRTTADRLIIESHFQLDPYATFARGARAILDADQNLYDGRYRGRLLEMFHKRGLRGIA